ncbi:MAG: hypothetical protein FWF46_09325, partial [Oscillospiraceae bacterium]|nr:hypothetical protein [Oscillospiraceae bacterium]
MITKQTFHQLFLTKALLFFILNKILFDKNKKESTPKLLLTYFLSPCTFRLSPNQYPRIALIPGK